jgi:hypothetical protein
MNDVYLCHACKIDILLLGYDANFLHIHTIYPQVTETFDRLNIKIISFENE